MAASSALITVIVTDAGWTLHAAGPNQTDEPRQAIQLVFFADGTKLSRDCELKYGDDILTVRLYMLLRANMLNRGMLHR